MLASIRHIFLRKYWVLCLFCLFLLAACTQSPTVPPVTSPTPGTTPTNGTGATGTPTTTATSTTTAQTGTSIPTEAFRAIRFVDALHGWALTKDMVLRTQDGGKTWVNVTEQGGSMLANSANSQPFTGGQNAQAVFQTIDRAWVFVTTAINGSLQNGITVHVWYTGNGGSNWTSSTFDDTSAEGFADRPMFINATTGWLLLSTGAGAGSYGVHLYQTTNGGTSWKQISAAPGNLPLGGSKAGPSFANANTGWIANFVAPEDNAVLLDKSTDGGVTWTVQHLPLVSAYSDAIYRPTPPVIFGATLYEPVHVTINGTANHLVMYKSSDGGNHWSVGTPANFDTDNVYVIDYQGDTVAIANGTVYHSNAQGNWSKIGTIPSTAGPMSFINAQEGWSLDTNSAVLYHTTNGGSSWQTITYSFVSNS